LQPAERYPLASIQRASAWMVGITSSIVPRCKIVAACSI
jgi:hypothetical protein